MSLQEECILRNEENLVKISTCLSLLSEDQIWLKPNSEITPIANQMLHICGNISQYVDSSLGGSTDERQRDVEFNTTNNYRKKDLFTKLKNVVESSTNVINSLSESELERKRIVQGFTMTGVGCLVHITEHLSYHTGQIVLLTKLMTKKDLAFYDGIDLNSKNS